MTAGGQSVVAKKGPVVSGWTDREGLRKLFHLRLILCISDKSLHTK